MNEETLKKAIKELNEEGLLNGTKITEKGKVEVEEILKEDNRCSEIVFKVFWTKLSNDFYEMSPREFCLRVLELEKLLKKSNIDLFEKLKNDKTKNTNNNP